MGSKTTSKSNRGKSVNNSASSKTSAKSNRQNRGDEYDETEDLSLLRKSVVTSVNGLAQVLKIFQTGTEEIKFLLSQECKLIYECRVCENLFRSVGNFLSHKRIYCQAAATTCRQDDGNHRQPNGLMIYEQSDAPNERSDGSLDIVIVEPEPPPKRTHNESEEDWKCSDPIPSEDTDMSEPLPKLESSVPPIRRRKDICGVIEKLSKRASRQNLANATAVAAHFAGLTGGNLCLENTMTHPTSDTLYVENIPETRNAVYQTILCKAASSMKLGLSSTKSGHSKTLAIRESRDSSSERMDRDSSAMADSFPNLPGLSARIPISSTSYNKLQCDSISPIPHDLLIKRRVSALKEAISKNEEVTIDEDGVIIPSKSNAPSYPPEVCLGGVSNSEGEEVEDGEEEDDDRSTQSSKGIVKGEASKNKSSEEKEEIICSVCKARFSTRKTLTHHMKSLHVMFRVYYRCPCCKNCFANSWSVHRHLYKVHRKSADQVRKLRALIKKKAFRKKILLPLPASSSQQNIISSSSDPLNEGISEEPSTQEKDSPTSLSKQPSCVTSVGRMRVGSGRSGSPLPPPSQATQFPAISAQHAQLLRKLENIVKQEDSHWKVESYPERPGMGQSCPGCNRRFERRAALASHAHSCHKRILLAAQKASRARVKQQQQKSSKATIGAKEEKEVEETEKDLEESKVDISKATLSNVKHAEKYPSSFSALKELVKNSGNETQTNSSFNFDIKIQPVIPDTQKIMSEVAVTIPSNMAQILSKPSPEGNFPGEKLKDEEWDEMVRPNSASSFGTHRDSKSPITVPFNPKKHNRIGIQIRKDYGKGDRASVCSSAPSPTPGSIPQNSKDGEVSDDNDDDVVILSSTYNKGSLDVDSTCSKDSVSAATEVSSDTERGVKPSNAIEASNENKILENKQLVVQLQDILSNKKLSDYNSFQAEDEVSSEQQLACEDVKEEEPANSSLEKPQVESVVEPPTEVKRVFLEVIVGGVADPNSLAMDEEDSGKVPEEKVDSSKLEKQRELESNVKPVVPKRKLQPSSVSLPRLGGRPVRNRVRVEREDFIYDLSDMKLSPSKRDDLSSGSHGASSMKKARRNISQQQFLSSASHTVTNTIDNSSSVKQTYAQSIVKTEGHTKGQSSNTSCTVSGTTLRVYSGKISGCSMPSDRPSKVSNTASDSRVQTSGMQKLGDCRVVIGGLRSGDMTQLSVRRVYTRQKVTSPSSTNSEAVETEDDASLNPTKKCNRSKECAVSLSDVDEGLFGEMSKVEIPTTKKETGKSSNLYHSDSLESIDCMSDCGIPVQKKVSIRRGEVKPKT